MRRSVSCAAVAGAELLSPAGSFDAARAAVNAGADAIYMGGPYFSARAYAESSSEDMLADAIDFCHMRGVRVFMTLNTLVKERELGGIAGYLRPYAEHGLDGVIVQDLGVMRVVRDYFPGLELHVSTQAAVTGPEYARLLLDAGAKRIVLARELSLKEIRHIYEETGAELEVFAHGALCCCYSGECLMSSMIGGRSGNRGRCAGTCRLPFEVYDDHRRLNSGDRRYVLSMKDLNTVTRLREMLDAGVYSFKIEGRMKSPEYVAAVTSVYRKYLDMALMEQAGAAEGRRAEKLRKGEQRAGDLRDGKPHARNQRDGEMCVGRLRVDSRDRQLLSETFDRGGETSAYLDGQNGAAMMTLAEKPAVRARNEDVIAGIRALYIDKDRKHPVKAYAVLRAGRPAELTLVSAAAWAVPGSEGAAAGVEERPPAGTGGGLSAGAKDRLSAGADGKMSAAADSRLSAGEADRMPSDMEDKLYAGVEDKTPVGSKNKPLTGMEGGLPGGAEDRMPGGKEGIMSVRAELTGIPAAAGDTRQTVPSVTVMSDFVVQEARSRAVTAEDAAVRLGRLGDTDFELAGLELDMDEDKACFVPVKVLNELRRSASEQLKAAILGRYRR